MPGSTPGPFGGLSCRLRSAVGIGPGVDVAAEDGVSAVMEICASLGCAVASGSASLHPVATITSRTTRTPSIKIALNCLPHSRTSEYGQLLDNMKPPLNFLSRRSLIKQLQRFLQIGPGLRHACPLTRYVQFGAQRNIGVAFTLNDHWIIRQSLCDQRGPGSAALALHRPRRMRPDTNR